MPLVDWLEKEPLFPKFYWENRESGEQFAAAGAVATLSHLPIEHKELWCGIARFPIVPSHAQSVWESNCPSLFFLPKKIERGKVIPSSFSSVFPRLLQREDLPSRVGWENRVEETLNAIGQGALEKVVLARQTSLSFNEDINVFTLLRKVMERKGRATFFLLQASLDQAFLGASPEKLYARKGEILKTEALAGTVLQEKKELLFKSKKLQNEVELVKIHLEELLFPLCEKITWQPQTAIQTANLYHLYFGATAHLKKETSDAALISLLNPTAALGGKPRDAALNWLLEKELFDRGWYGGAIGWASAQEADFSVAIRSALVVKNQLHLFSGAGILEGSSPANEWEELENKIAPYMKLFL